MGVLDQSALGAVAAAWNLVHPPHQPRDCIVLYHSIHPSLPYRTCAPDVFRKELQWLTSHCDVVRVREVLGPRPAGSARPRVAITFDDGFIDNYETAFPLLLEYGAHATFFVTAGLVDRDPVVLARYQNFRHTGRAHVEPMRWEHLREIGESGMEIGSHTYSHPSLFHLGDADVEFELRRSRQLLEERLQRPVHGLAYPFGKPGCTYGPRDAELAKTLGYRYALTAVHRGVLPRDSSWHIPRIALGDERFPLPEQIAGRWDWIGAYNEHAPIPIARMISPRGFRASTYGGSYHEMAAAVQPER